MNDHINPNNKYDINDIVRRESVMYAGALKIATYRVRDMETLEFGALQIHVTYDNVVIAVLSETMLSAINSFVKPGEIK